MTTLNIYTDGAASNNKTHCGGWACGFFVNNDKEPIRYISGKDHDTTNNIMEMTAVIEALKIVRDLPNNIQYDINLYTDSAYIFNCINQKWYIKWKANGWITASKTPVLNKELWIEMLDLLEETKVSINKVTAHASSYQNNFVDSLAVKAKKEMEDIWQK